MSEASGFERSLAWLPREVRGEVEGKILQAASMGYQKGIAAGRAQTAASRSDADRREMEALRRELEDLRASEHLWRAGCSTTRRPHSPNLPPTHPAVDKLRPPIMHGVMNPIFGVDDDDDGAGRGGAGADTHSRAPSTPSGGHSVADTAFRPAGDERDAIRPAHLPKDAGVMPEEVSLARHSGGSTAPTAAMWALSVSAKAGVIPKSAREALDLTSSGASCGSLTISSNALGAPPRWRGGGSRARIEGTVASRRRRASDAGRRAPCESVSARGRRAGTARMAGLGAARSVMPRALSGRLPRRVRR